MPLTTLPVGSEASLYASMKEASAAATGNVYLMVTTAHEAGKPWCGDCVAAEALINALFAEGGALANDTLVASPLARAEYRKPTHPFRVDAELAVTAVPTLYKWNKETNLPEKERLIEGETYELPKLRAFLGLPEDFAFPQ